MLCGTRLTLKALSQSLSLFDVSKIDFLVLDSKPVRSFVGRNVRCGVEERYIERQEGNVGEVYTSRELSQMEGG